MVYYLRSTMMREPASESMSEVSQSTPSSDDNEKMVGKYYPCFLHAIYAVAITFLVCHLLVRFFSPKFLCKLDKNGEVILGKEGYGYTHHRKLYLITAVVGVITLLVSIGNTYKQ